MEAVSGLPQTNYSYLVARNQLFERFGKTNLLVTALYTKLVDLPAPSTKPSSLRKFYDDLEKRIRSLENTGQTIDKRLLILPISSKAVQQIYNNAEKSQ